MRRLASAFAGAAKGHRELLQRVTGSNYASVGSVALLGAAVSIPQTIAFSNLAGMPVEAGISLALLPALIAIAFSKTRVTLSGPNTAVSIVLFTSASAVAVPGSPDYINQVLLITLFAGIFQLVLALGRAGSMFLLMPPTIAAGIVIGTGVLTICQQIGPALGVAVTANGVYDVVMQAVLFDNKNYAVLAVVVICVAVGAVVRKIAALAKYSLLAAMLAGCIASALFDAFLGKDAANIEYVGRIAVELTRLSGPSFSILDWSLIIDALHGGLAVAIIGSLQAIVLTQSVSSPRGGAPAQSSVNTDVLAQALMNLTAPFVSAYAGAASFNRTFSHIQAGGATKLDGVATLIVAFLVVISAPWLVAQVSMPAVTGVLILVGWGLATGFRSEHRESPRKVIETIAAAVLTVTMGVTNAIIGGAVIALYVQSFGRSR